ncbi:terminase [Brevibacillus laterosporus]|nr:terminase [Brevibacillus laterosporus]
MQQKNDSPDETLTQKAFLLRELRLRHSRNSFWEYCKTTEPDFYQDHRTHLILLCNTLQDLYESKLLNKQGISYKRLMINMPPRHGKSRTLQNFCKWVLGKDRKNRIISCSYGDDLSMEFSRNVRNGIEEGKKMAHEICYQDIFPHTKIKKGHGATKDWALDGSHFNYLGTSVNGMITGKGCSIGIVDDPVKSAYEASNEEALDKIWSWYTNTYLSRIEEGGIQIINMTRWSKNDPCGRILDSKEADKWYVLKLEVKNEKTGEMLCPDLMSHDTYESLKTNVEEAIFRANYHQESMDVKGRLYPSFNRYDYDKLPNFEKIIAYVDTADQGNDYLAAIVSGIHEGRAYILDILYTVEPMEITEGKTADILHLNKVNQALFESNNGGRGFARNVERLLWENHKTRMISIETFHQSKKKVARIEVASPYVLKHMYFPSDLEERFPEYYKAMSRYQRQGKNKYDDAPDATTGIAEMIEMGSNEVMTENLGIPL